MDQLWYIHAMKCNLVISRYKLATHTTVWTNCQNIVLSERIQTQRPACHEMQ